MNTCDVVYWWNGTCWKPADPNCSESLGGCGGDSDMLVDRIKRMGYICVKGLKSEGPPNDPPVKNQF